MYFRQLQFVGSNYICTLTILTQLRGSELFFPLTALLLVNGWIGSFFINRIGMERRVRSIMNDTVVIAACLLFYVAYALNFVPLEESLFMALVLLVRIIHDYFRKRLFLNGDEPEWIPFILKLFILAMFLVNLPPLLYAGLYAALYGACMTYYYSKTEYNRFSSLSREKHTAKGRDFLVALRVSYRNVLLLCLPYFYPDSATIKDFLYFWPILSVLALINDMIERHALRAALPLSRKLVLSVASVACCTIMLSLAVLPETLLLVALILTYQVLIALDNYRYVIGLKAGDIAQLYSLELIRILGAFVFLMSLYWLGVPVIWMMTLFIVWEVAIAVYLSRASR